MKNYRFKNQRAATGGFVLSAIMLACAPSAQAAPLDYEVGNASVRVCKLVYSDGRPDEPLPACTTGNKDFGNVTTPFKVKVVMTNEVNQDIESDWVDVGAVGCESINPADIKVGFDVKRLVGCTIRVDGDYALGLLSYNFPVNNNPIERACAFGDFTNNSVLLNGVASPLPTFKKGSCKSDIVPLGSEYNYPSYTNIAQRNMVWHQTESSKYNKKEGYITKNAGGYDFDISKQFTIFFGKVWLDVDALTSQVVFDGFITSRNSHLRIVSSGKDADPFCGLNPSVSYKYKCYNYDLSNMQLLPATTESGLVVNPFLNYPPSTSGYILNAANLNFDYSRPVFIKIYNRVVSVVKSN